MKKSFRRIVSVLVIASLLLVCPVIGRAADDVLYYGDMNMDGHITASDVLILKNILTGQYAASGDSLDIGNINEDESVNSSDLLLLNQHILGINRIRNKFVDAMWSAVPLTSAAQASAGIGGGEGCQWPLFITFSEADGNIAFLGTDVGGLYRSTDGGVNWKQSTIGLGAEGATGIAVDPNNGNRVLAQGVNSTTNANNGLYLSEDCGITWRPVKTLDTVQGHRDYRGSIAFDKSSNSTSVGGSSTAYWLTEAGVLYKSTDGGVSWSQVNNSSYLQNGEICVNPSNGYVYVASDDGFYVSTNNGKSFKQKLTGNIRGIDVILTQPNNVYLCSSNGIHISTDSGSNFSTVTGTNYPTQYPSRIEVSPADPNYMVLTNDYLGGYGAYSNLIFYTQNGGQSWSTASRDCSMSAIPYNCRSEVFSWHPTDKNVALSTGGDFVMRSTDGGKTFKWSNSGYNGACVTNLSYNVNNESLMYAANQDYSGFYSTDGGRIWKYINWYAGWGGFTYGGYVVDANTVVAINKYDNGTRYIYYTTDGGSSVHNTNITVSSDYSCVTGVPGDNNIVFCNNYRSTNKGVNWSQMSGCAAVFASNPNNGTLYGVNSNGRIVKSTDKGASWNTVGNYSNGIYDMTYDVNGNRLLIVNGSDLVYSVNCSNGSVTTISSLSGRTDGFGGGLILRAIAVDPENGNRFYVGNARHVYASDMGVLMTENNGASWTNLTSTRGNIYPGADGGREVDKLMIVPSTRTLYAAGMCRGIYKTVLPFDDDDEEDTQSTEEGTVTRYGGTRDPWLWPFADTSIWNMPIGSNATLQNANLQDCYCWSIDDEIIMKVPEGSPTVNILAPSSWNQRWPGTNVLGSMQVPSDLYIPDSTQTSTPNYCSAFLMPDGRTIKQLEPTCRLQTGNAQIVGYPREDIDIYGDGINGSHWGSGMSTLGGSIRLGELTSDEPIKHAIKLDLWGKKYCYYDRNNNCGYVWPADRNDSYAASGDNAYGGTIPALRMGSLLTIPKNVTAESLGLQTEVGRKLFYALQNYGCYIVDDSAWDCYGWCAQDGVRDEVRTKYGIELDTTNSSDPYFRDATKLVKNLYIVTNNSANSVGGGGTPCKPLAPYFQ